QSRWVDRLSEKRSLNLVRANGVGDGCILQPGDGNDVAGLCLIDTRALKSAKCQELGHTAVFDQIAVTVEHFDVLVWLDGGGRNAAGNDAAEIGVGLENSAEHAERPIFDLGRSHVVEHEVKERHHRLLRPFQCWCHPTFLGRAIKNWKVKLSLGGVEGGEQ